MMLTRRRPSGAWSLFFLVCLVVGLGAGPATIDTPPRDCAPVTRFDAEAWQLLTEQGYRESALASAPALIPPGCESAR
jgi:hypothetical protein